GTSRLSGHPAQASREWYFPSKRDIVRVFGRDDRRGLHRLRLRRRRGGALGPRLGHFELERHELAPGLLSGSYPRGQLVLHAADGQVALVVRALVAVLLVAVPEQHASQFVAVRSVRHYTSSPVIAVVVGCSSSYSSSATRCQSATP